MAVVGLPGYKAELFGELVKAGEIMLQHPVLRSSGRPGNGGGQSQTQRALRRGRQGNQPSHELFHYDGDNTEIEGCKG